MDIAGLYWRRNALSAAKCPPGLLALNNGRLSFTTADARVFDEPASTVTGRLTGWGSLVLEVSGSRYVLLTTVGQLSTPFTKAQRGAIAAATRSSSLRALPEWPALLRAAGAAVTSPRLAYRPWALGALLVVVAIGATIAIVLNGGL